MNSDHSAVISSPQEYYIVNNYKTQRLRRQIIQKLKNETFNIYLHKKSVRHGGDRFFIMESHQGIQKTNFSDSPSIKRNMGGITSTNWKPLLLICIKAINHY